MAENTQGLKEKVIANFVERDTACRIVICTEAFGMGMDCPNIHQIVHYGPARNMEAYTFKKQDGVLETVHKKGLSSLQ